MSSKDIGYNYIMLKGNNMKLLLSKHCTTQTTTLMIQLHFLEKLWTGPEQPPATAD